jgi:hypothetical protein
MIEDLRRDPAMPVFWGSNKPGMQAGAELTADDLAYANAEWHDALDCCIRAAEEMVRLGLHKQIANRILEPWAHINVVVTATDWENFFELRAHPDAQPEMKVLALEMLNALCSSHPQHLAPEDWHLPYITRDDVKAAQDRITGNGVMRVVPMPGQINDILKKVSTARCARVSYLTHDGRQTTVEEDLKLFDRLVGSKPLHASPAEHQATPDEALDPRPDGTYEWARSDLHGNFTGWIQFRKTLEI